MVIQFQPLETPVIDPRNEIEIVDQALLNAYTVSQGLLNDFSLTSPLRALIEGLAFAAAELLYYANKLIDAIAINFLSIAGVQQRLGIAAKTTLTFTLSQVNAGNFTIPQGYKAKTSNGITFTTDVVLIIPPGNITGSVSATCTVLGIIGNIAAGSINQLTDPLAFLSSVNNLQAATGGMAEETIDEVKARGFAALRRKGLVSQDDYEQESKAFLGAGSTAYAIGNRDGDKISFLRGSIHVFALNADGSLLSIAQLETLQTQLKKRSNFSIFVYVSNVDILLVDVKVICKYIPGTNLLIVSQEINDRVRAYLTPGKQPLGASIVLKELEFLVRLCNVSYVQSVTIGASGDPLEGTNLDLPNDYAVAKLRNLTIDLVNGDSVYTQQFNL